jgi:alpha-glucosidase
VNISGEPWWSQAVIYQIYPRSFFDSNGDGEGDLAGITSKIKYLSSLGIDAIWLSPFYESPNKDGGYDVSDPRAVDPRFGTITDFKNLVDTCHQNQIRVIVDLVPNHFSDQHKWFQEALNSPSGSAARNRFHFRKTPSGKELPNNWISLFGGPVWTKTADGEFYLHLFDQSQPDLNWENSEVREDFEHTLKFWLDHGVDGFRIDVAHGLVKENLDTDHHAPQALSDALRLDIAMDSDERSAILSTVPFFNRPGVHEVYRRWRKIFDSYERDVVSVAEVWVHPPEEAAKYVRPDELSQVFNFDLLTTPFEAKSLRHSIESAFSILKPIGALPTWALSNHDSPRVASRIGVQESQALFIALLALPGSLYIYNGQELSLPDAQVADQYRQDPVFFRTNGEQKGRDGARVPLPWNSQESEFGFTQGKPWLPIPQSWQDLSIDKQEEDAESSLHLYRHALQVRRDSLKNEREIFWRETGQDGLLVFERGDLLVLLNTSSEEKFYPVSGDLLLTSHSGVTADGNLVKLPKGTACWVSRLA